MKKRTIGYFLLALTSLCIALVFYFQSNVSVAKFLVFYLFGMASGINLIKGIDSWRKTK